MSITPGAGAPTLEDRANRGVFFRLDGDPPLRLWTGRGKIRIAGNDLDPDPEIYTGLGVIKNLPELDRLLNGEARRVALALSGLNQEAVDLIDASSAVLDGLHARFGQMRYDRNWQPLGAIRWVWDGILDETGIEAVRDGDQHSWTVTISLSSALVQRNRPTFVYWTPQDRPPPPDGFPRDEAFDFVPTYNSGSTRLYPPR